MPYATVNPATGQTERTFPSHTPAEVEERLQRAADTFASYRLTTFAERARHLHNTADLFEGEAPEIARIVTTEMGKTFASARAEAANAFIREVYLPAHNARFAVDPAGEGSA